MITMQIELHIDQKQLCCILVAVHTTMTLQGKEINN